MLACSSKQGDFCFNSQKKVLAEIDHVTLTKTVKPVPPGNYCLQLNAQLAGIWGAQTHSQLLVYKCSRCSLELDFMFNDLT